MCTGRLCPWQCPSVRIVGWNCILVLLMLLASLDLDLSCFPMPEWSINFSSPCIIITSVVSWRVRLRCLSLVNYIHMTGFLHSSPWQTRKPHLYYAGFFNIFALPHLRLSRLTPTSRSPWRMPMTRTWICFIMRCRMRMLGYPWLL